MMLSAKLWVAVLALSTLSPATHSLEHTVQLDLRRGLVFGYSKYIRFLAIPDVSSRNRRCDRQAVIRLDLSGPFKVARFSLEYDRPRLWTLDLSDSFGDGNGGDNGTTSNMAETQVYNRQFRVYGNNLPGYLEESVDGGLLLKVTDDIVDKKDRLVIEIADETLEWVDQHGFRQVMESEHLYTLSGQNTTYGEKDAFIYAGFNRVVATAARFGSGLCRVNITLKGEDKDDCHKADCHKDAECLSKRRSYRCRCKPGFYGNGKICVDDEECEFENGQCVHFCHNSPGSYTCSCKPGFLLAPDGHNCIDDNECFRDKGGCEHQCINTQGSYECKCNAGYSLQADGRTCQVGTWCESRRGCAQGCQRTTRGYNEYIECTCRDGYVLHPNKKDCIPTCRIGNGGCQHICNDSLTPPHHPSCSCAPLYKLAADKKSCIATCGVNNGGCDKRCVDTDAGPECSCPPGFVLHQDKKRCLDVNECSEESNGGCSHNCINTHGSFECTCPRGYKVQDNQITCEDVDECKQSNSTCDHTCENTIGSFTCHCADGYERYGQTHCADKNECTENNGGCQHLCVNMKGKHHCECRRGYKLHQNNRDCIETNQCVGFPAPAKADVTCHAEAQGKGQVCEIRCHANAHFLSSAEADDYTMKCGEHTGYQWMHNGTAVIPSCSESVSAPSLKRRAQFMFLADECSNKPKTINTFQQNLNNVFKATSEQRCKGQCRVQLVDLLCPGRTHSRKLRRRGLTGRGLTGRGLTDKQIIIAKFEVQVNPKKPTAGCDVACRRHKAERRLKNTIKFMRRSIDKEQFYVRFEGIEYGVTKQTLRASRMQEVCEEGQVAVSKKCVACSVGTYYNASSHTCMACPAGTYQDEEGAKECKPCPHTAMGVPGAANASMCEGLCKPGHYSSTGFVPCTPCPQGQYQPSYGRMECMDCGPGVQTQTTGSTGFQDCLVKDRCLPGHYYRRAIRKCVPCERDTYQPRAGQDYCMQCPGSTRTDSEGALNSTQCKDHQCGGEIGAYQGFIQSPNWPGDYPADIECTWTITPKKGRRILVVIPEIFLATSDECSDYLVMRKSASPYSVSTYETCRSTEQPRAFTARSRKLWIRFKASNKSKTAKGFSIPYVAYDEEYQDLIEDIVSDGRLYSSYQNQEVLKDRSLLAALLDVIVHPYNYFKYHNVSNVMFPESFLRLLRNKVDRFYIQNN